MLLTEENSVDQGVRGGARERPRGTKGLSTVYSVAVKLLCDDENSTVTEITQIHTYPF